jgi:transmembrane sensor
MDRSYTSATDFLLDDSFTAYCLKTDPVAIAYWEQWQSKNPGLLREFHEAVELFHTLNTTDQQQQQTWAAFEHLLQQHKTTLVFNHLAQPENETKASSKQRIPNYRKALLVAACVTGILLLGAAFWLFTERKSSTGIAIQQTADTIRTIRGQQKKILLPDKSTVVLNYGSTLIIPPGFGKDPMREVQLEGEAAFYVKADPLHPFIVQSGKVRTTVLGTVFNVNAYPKNDHTAITVLEGKVGVAVAKDSVTLLPGKQAVYHKIAGSLFSAGTDAASIFTWQEGRLRFQENTMEQIAFILENKFNTPVRFRQQEIRKELFTASFAKDMSLTAIAEVLCTNRDIQFILRNDTLWFYNR